MRLQQRNKRSGNSCLNLHACAAQHALQQDTEYFSNCRLQDLIQFQGRERWYEAKFCADDAPDWNPATFLRKEQKTPSLQTVVLEVEISREKVPIRNAYKHVGQQAAVRVNSGMERFLAGMLF